VRARATTALGVVRYQGHAWASGKSKERGFTIVARENFGLTLIERLILSNQYLILERLDPDNAKHYALLRKAVEEGYALEYGRVADGLYEEFSAEECAEVRDILELHRALHLSAMKVGVEPDKVRFRGFDGNNETAQMAYTRYLLGDCGLWAELHRKGHGYNSHSVTLGRYRGMVQQWKVIGGKHDLSKEEIERILAADVTGDAGRQFTTGP
jgi:uncharacterized protein